MTTIGYATLQIIPSLKGVSAEINKQLAAERDMGTDAGKRLSANLVSGIGSPGKKIGKELESGVADGAKGAAGQIQSRLSERLGSQVGLVVGRGVGTALRGSITGAAKVAEVALKAGLTGAAGVAAVAMGGVGLALTKGFDRLKSIDQAKFKLQALGNDAAAVAKIMDSALASVKGTAFGMDDAVTAAASAVAAGIKPGQDLTKYLKEVGDAAAIAGTSFTDMGSIFNKIQTSNKAYTDDLQQLSDRGLPIFQWLQKEYGVTADALSKMVQDGQVDAAHFQHAIETNIGGAAQKMGQSFEGSVQNAEAALGRLGAALLAPIFGNAAGGIGSITDGLDKLTKWVNDHQPEIITFFTDMGVAAVSVAQDMVKSFGQIIQGVGDFSHALGTAIGLFDEDKGRELQAVGDTLNGIGDKLISTADGFDVAKDKIRAWGDATREAAENAQGAYGPVTGLGTALGALPFKKVIAVEVDTGGADSKIAGVGNALGRLPFKKNIELTVNGQVLSKDGVKITFDGVTGPAWANDPNHPLIGPQNNGPITTPNQNGIPILHKAFGGKISGPGGIDNVLMWGTAGEGVLTTDAMGNGGSQIMAALNAGWKPSANLLHAILPGYETGGVVGGPDVLAAKDLIGTPYSQGQRFDCSGMVARVIDRTLGMSDGGLMSTKNAAEWLAARGFEPGIGGPGQISVGWYDHGPNPNDGHMAMTLSDGTNAEAGGKNGVFTVGAGAAGATSPQFDQHMFLPTVYGEGQAGSSSASPFAGGSAVAAVTGGAAPSSGGSAPSSSGSGGVSIPSSLSGLATMGLDTLNVKTKVSPDSPERTFDLGGVASAAIGGQVDSLLGVAGIGGSPPWLQAISTLASGISIGGGDAAPLSASPMGSGTPPPDDPGNMHGARAGQAPGPTYNVYAQDAEDALHRLQRLQNQQTAAKTSHL